jgi:signal transduction histidine kinase
MHTVLLSAITITKDFRTFVLALLFFAAHCAAQTEHTAEPLNQPVAYCLTPLTECTAEKQIKMESTLPRDLRILNGGQPGPVTLVYALPPRTDLSQEYSIMIAPYRTNNCFRFDDATTTQCTESRLTQIKIPTEAKLLRTQAIQIQDVRIWVPNMVWGTTAALQARTTTERDSLKILTGWYLFVYLATLFQLITQRNQRLTICLSLLLITVLARINVTGNGSFSGIQWLSPEDSRVIEYLTIPFLCIFIIEYYSILANQPFLKIRKIYYGALTLAIVFIAWASQPQHILWSLQFAQILLIPCLVLMSLCVFNALQKLDKKQSAVLLLGVSSIAIGSLIDLSTSVRGLPLFGGIGFGPIGIAVEVLCQYILIALRNDKAHHEARAFQEQLVNTLRNNERQLEEKVAQRTTELQNANQEIQQAYQTAKKEHKMALEARQQATKVLMELKSTQGQLIQAEKMASLGLLVSNVAHEINTPIGAVKSSGALIADTMQFAVSDLSDLFGMLSKPHRDLFVQLINGCMQTTDKVSTREERALTKAISTELEQAQVQDAKRKARILLKLCAHQQPLDYLPLLTHPDNDFIFSVANHMADIMNGTDNINNAVERVSRVVYALKALSGDDVAQAVTVAPVLGDMESALAKFLPQMHRVTLQRVYQPDMPPLRADHDALAQLCIHLVMNALQAMNYEGTLTVGLRSENNHAIISVTDTGTGIVDDIKNRIFEPFFTTRTSGEGSGMGLAVVKRIVEQHHGRIEMQSQIGIGATFTVVLPYTD